MICTIILALYWIAISVTEGVRDGHFFHNKMTSVNPDKQDIHWLFTVERLIGGSLIFYIYSINNHHLIDAFIFSAGLVLIFSYFHNGSYYCTRNSLDRNIYTKRWKDSSSTSQSWIELNYKTRLVMMMAGAALIFISHIAYKMYSIFSGIMIITK